MHRFYLSPSECQGNQLTLGKNDSHHAAHVLRLKPGQAVTVLDGEGLELRTTIASVSKSAVSLDIIESINHPRPRSGITLFQAIPKGKAMETIIQKATELGAFRIVPLLTERTEIQLKSEQAEKKKSKWVSIMIEAIKQCGNPWLPTLDVPKRLSFPQPDATSPDLSLIASLSESRQHPHSCFKEYRSTHGHSPTTVDVWIGPEGDFSPREHDQIVESGAHPISLGQLVLRADTAAVAALAVITHELSVNTA